MDEINLSVLNPRQKLTKARIKLLREFPFFGTIAMRFRLVETRLLPTTAVDPYGNLYFNPDWVEKFTDVDAVFEFAHEVMHIVQRTLKRRPKEANNWLWNKASDQIIDTLLVDANLPQSAISIEMVPPTIQEKCRNAKILEVRYREILEECKNEQECPACKEIVNNLLKALPSAHNLPPNCPDSGNEGEENKGNAGNNPQAGEGEDNNSSNQGGSGEKKHTCGGSRHCCSDSLAGAMEQNNAQIDNESSVQFKWEQAIIAGVEAEKNNPMKSRGNIPGIVNEFIASLKKPSVRWTDKIRFVASSVFKGNYTYKRHSRRGPAMGIRLPGRAPEVKGLACLFDTSGSMSEEEINQCISEVVAIMKQCNCPSIYMIFHDVPAYHAGEFTKDDLKKIKISQGGTSHMDAFKIIEGDHPTFKMEERPGMIIAFTDMGSDIPMLKDPGIPVIWAYTGGSYGSSIPVPFGTKVEVKLT